MQNGNSNVLKQIYLYTQMKLCGISVNTNGMQIKLL